MTETPSFVLEGLSSSACDVTIYFITDSIIETQPMTIYRNSSKISDESDEYEAEALEIEW